MIINRGTRVIAFILSCLMLLLSGCYNIEKNNQKTGTYNLKQSSSLSIKEINTINKITNTPTDIKKIKDICSDKNIQEKFVKQTCLFFINVNLFFINSKKDANYRSKQFYNKNDANKNLKIWISNYSKILGQKNLNTIPLLKESLIASIYKTLISDKRSLYLRTNDINFICDNLDKNKLDNRDNCLSKWITYQHLDVCSYMSDQKEKEKCFNEKINLCNKILDEKDKTLCIYNIMLNTKDDKELLKYVKSAEDKKIISRLLQNSNNFNNKELKDKEQHDINIFKQIFKVEEQRQKELCNKLYSPNLKYECNILVKIINNKEFNKKLEKGLKIKNEKQKTKVIINFNDIIRNKKQINSSIEKICNYNNIDDIKKTEEFLFLEQIIKLTEDNDKKEGRKNKYGYIEEIINGLYNKCLPKLGYITTEEIFMNLIWQDNLMFEDKIKITWGNLHSDKYYDDLKSKKINFDYKNGIFSMMLRKYKYWRYNNKTFFLNRLIDNVLYRKIINDIYKGIGDKGRAIELIKKEYNLKSNNQNELLKKIAMKIGIESKNLIKLKELYTNKVLEKTLEIEETRKNFRTDILNSDSTKKIIELEYILMSLGADKLFNDTKTRENFFNKLSFNGYFIENLFRFYRLENGGK